MTIQFPRRRWDEDLDCWVPEMPPVDSRAELEHRLQVNRHRLEAKLLDGRPAYTERAREIIRAEYDVERSEFLASRMTILDKVIESSIASGQHSNAVGALKLQAELTRLLDRR